MTTSDLPTQMPDHGPECCDHDAITGGICMECGDQTGPITVTLTLAGLPANCPHCGAFPRDGQWGLGPHHGLLQVICPFCFTAIATVRAIAAKDSDPR